jgi:hypothetical protein
MHFSAEALSSFVWIARIRSFARDYERLPETLAGLPFPCVCHSYAPPQTGSAARPTHHLALQDSGDEQDDGFLLARCPADEGGKRRREGRCGVSVSGGYANQWLLKLQSRAGHAPSCGRYSGLGAAQTNSPPISMLGLPLQGLIRPKRVSASRAGWNVWLASRAM